MISSQNIKQTYDRFSSIYDLFFKSALEHGRERAIEILAPQSGSNVLEIGVGTGLNLEYYPGNINVIGFDFSHGMLKEARLKSENSCHCRVDLMQMDAQTMAFADHSFDYLMGAYVLTVVPDPDRAVKEIFRVAKPGAKVVLVNYVRSSNRFLSFFENLLHPFFSSIGLFTLDHDIPGILARNGAENIKMEPTSFLNLHQIISFTVPVRD